MKFSDIDFSAISRMMDSMSEEEKNKLNDMAQSMMSNMKNNEADQEQSEEDMYTFLNINEEDYSDLPGDVLDQIEAAVDLEQYYEDVSDSDLSASVLFYGKAILNVLRKYHYPVYKNVLDIDGFMSPQTTTLSSYLTPLMNEDTIHLLVDEGFGNSEDWIVHKNFLQQAYILLNRAEYDRVDNHELQMFKQCLFDQKGLLSIKRIL